MPTKNNFGSMPGLESIRVDGEIGRRMALTMDGNLLKLDVERDFIAPFRAKTGAYIGVGILLNAASRFAAYSKDERIVQMRDHLARELVALQESIGYIGPKPAGEQFWKLFDCDEIFQTLTGLLAHHRLTGDKQTRAAAHALGRFVVRAFRAGPSEAVAACRVCDTLRFLGLELGLMDAYETLGDADLLDFCVCDRNLRKWRDPVVLGRWGSVEGHAYAYMAKCLAQLQLCRLDARPAVPGTVRKLLDFLMHGNGQTITGAVSDWECWHNTQAGDGHLGETCATVYLIELLDTLLRLEGHSLYADLIERMVFNTLFAAQSADGRRLRYYTAFEGPRVYYDKDTYCCPNNYRLAISCLPDRIYHVLEDGIRVNLYTASQATFRLPAGRVVLEQATDYPRAGDILLCIGLETPLRFALSLRLPRWCPNPAVSIGSVPVEHGLQPGKFLRIEREWQPGDCVTITLPMPWRAVRGRQAQAGRIAVMRGPMVYCLSRAANPALKDASLRDLAIDPHTLRGPIAQASGPVCQVDAWPPGKNNDFAATQPDRTLVLTEFPDPAGEAVYFPTPNPNDPVLQEDELLSGV